MPRGIQITEEDEGRMQELAEKGKTNSEIAKEMGLTFNTIVEHIGLRKAHCRVCGDEIIYTSTTDLCQKCYKKDYEKKYKTHGVNYLGYVVCPTCGKKGGLVKNISGNTKTGKTWVWYRVQHKVWNKKLYKKLRQTMSPNTAKKQKGLWSGLHHRVSAKQVIALIGSLP